MDQILQYYKLEVAIISGQHGRIPRGFGGLAVEDIHYAYRVTHVRNYCYVGDKNKRWKRYRNGIFRSISKFYLLNSHHIKFAYMYVYVTLVLCR